MNNKKKISVSHLLLFVIMLIYFIVVISSLLASAYLMQVGEYSYSSEIYIGLFGFSGICGSCTIGFYCNKAKAENKIVLDNIKYDKRLELAKSICMSAKDGEIDNNAFNLLRVLISDSEVAIIDDVIDNEGG